jgi:hypothetical protein
VSWITVPPETFDLPWSSSVREFRDAAGVQWSVFLAIPHSAPSEREKILPEAYRLGWLVFECDVERRRLAPVPTSWETMTDDELDLLRIRADVVPTRASRRATVRPAPAPLSALAEVDAGPSHGVRQPAPPQVAEVQERLARVIDEVCDKAPVQSLDTGELIRVKDVLTIAAQAADEAVALRRAARARHAP